MQQSSLFLLFVIFSFKLIANCPSPDGLYTDNYSFNSTASYVEGHWDSMLELGVNDFLIKYKHIDSLEWNNLSNLDSTSTSRIIGPLDYNTTYVWSVVAFCDDNEPEWSVVDTFTTLEYIECPSTTNLYTDNVIVTENSGFVNSHWDSMLGSVDHFILNFKSVDDTIWEVLSNMDSTINTRIIGGNLEHDNYYEWRVQAYCSQNQSYYSQWSERDTFYIGNFVPQAFLPEIDITISSLICEEFSDITFSAVQTLNQPDIQSTKITSNLGSIDLLSLEIGQIVGNATVTAGINDFINNDYTLEVNQISVINNEVEIALNSNESGDNDSYFSVLNADDGGIEISIVAPTDNNSYTSGNSLEITLSDMFINPSPSLMQFDVNVFSELNDNIYEQYDFNIDCESTTIFEYSSEYLLYPNPASSYVSINLTGDKTIKIVDVSGQLVSLVNTSSQIIDIDYLNSGIYFVEVQNETNLGIYKLIVR